MQVSARSDYFVFKLAPPLIIYFRRALIQAGALIAKITLTLGALIWQEWLLLLGR